MQQGLERDGGMVLKWCFHLTIIDTLDTWVPGAGVKHPREQSPSGIQSSMVQIHLG